MKEIKIFLVILILLAGGSLTAQTKEQSSKLQKRSQKYGHHPSNRERSNVYVVPRNRINPYYSPYYSPWVYPRPRWDWNPYSTPVYPRTIPPRDYYDSAPVIEPKISRNSESRPFLTLGLNVPVRVNNGVGLGMFFAGGRESFFMFSFDMVGNNPYVYYANISKWEAINEYNDLYLGREGESFSYSFGGGKRVKNFYPYAALTILDDKRYLVYFDELRILSSSGRYTIDDDSDVKYGLALGSFYRVDPISLNIFFNTAGTFGAGLGYTF